MKEKVILTVLAAVVGGIVGAISVITLAPKQEMATSFDELTVKKLKIADSLYLWPEGAAEADLVMANGGIIARTRIIATQICGNLLLGNAVFTTPDSPQNQVDQCRIYTEMGSNPNTGGAFVVRSPSGAHVLSKGIAPSGYSYNVGFDEKDTLWGYSLDNSTKERALMVLAKANPQQQQKSPSSAVLPETPAMPTVSPTATPDQNSATSAMVQQNQQIQNQQIQNPQMMAQPGFVPQTR